MATEQKTEGSQETNVDQPGIGFTGQIEAKYRELREHAEAYPYVWASYIVVYGGFGLWTLYRWRKLRKTEDRVRGLQERLRQLAQAEESAAGSSASAASEKPASSSTHANGQPK